MRFWLKDFLKDLRYYPSALLGGIVIGIMALISLAVPLRIPYSEAVRLWRGGEEVWYRSPRQVPPAWVNWFRRDKLADTLIFSTRDQPSWKRSQPAGEGRRIEVEFVFNYPYDTFPQELALYIWSSFREKAPFLVATWKTPDGRSIRVAELRVEGIKQGFRFSQDRRLLQRLEGVPPEEALFSTPGESRPRVLKGTYRLRIEAVTFEPDADVDVEFIAYGQVYGWAGTDRYRRDLGVALLWGFPVAMAFGVLGSVGTTLIAMGLAAVGVWFRGWVDELIQRLVEIFSIIPFLPVLILVGTLYSRSLVVILGVAIVLSVFSITIKNYRAIFLQIRELPYIEAAQAYGAGSGRIILRYLLPRVLPLMIPNLVIGVPSFVFLEASLAVLGLGDPVLPTWGKVLDEAIFSGSLLQGSYYWVLEPAFLLMVAGLSFSTVGFALDRVFNPRLREI
ncbi:ABC transporter permease [Thermoflexus sp.]|uniref:ABC transporter permease n=1 Tax=Thermoflexus sp. TaxID=1969742 RepID=UPI001758AAE8|nr:ABC transporter permease [Thermoflexus sp.]